MLFSANELNDMYMVDIAKSEWTDLDALIQGTAPLGRRFPGFSIANAVLFIFGGYNSNLGKATDSFLKCSFIAVFH